MLPAPLANNTHRLFSFTNQFLGQTKLKWIATQIHSNIQNSADDGFSNTVALDFSRKEEWGEGVLLIKAQRSRKGLSQDRQIRSGGKDTFL